MPRLKQSIRDGHFYIRGNLFGQRLVTWQVSNEGVSYLQKRGRNIDDEIPPILFKELLNKGYLSTGGTGSALIVKEKTLIFAPDYNSLHLCIRWREESWSPCVIFPELPTMWATDPALLAQCFLELDGTSLSAVKLFPGKGGVVVPVSPKESPYSIKSTGRWPVEWDIRRWTHDIEGFRKSGTLFEKDDDALRLQQGEYLILGKSYYLVFYSPSAQTITHQSLYLPSSIQKTEFSSRTDWKILELLLPNRPDDQLREWAAHMGYSLKEPIGQISLLAPIPFGFTAHQIPIVEVGQDLIFEISFPMNGDQDNQDIEFAMERIDKNGSVTSLSRSAKYNPILGTVYLKSRADRVSTYRLRSESGLFAPLTFLGMDKALTPLINTLTIPLSLELKLLDRKFSISAFEKDFQNYQVFLNTSDMNLPIEVEVHCPTPVTLTWTGNGIHSQQINVDVKEVHSLIIADLWNTLKTNNCFYLALDAGTYGRIELTVVPPMHQQITKDKREKLHLSSHQLKIGQWLSWIILADRLRTNESMVLLPKDVRENLSMVSGYFPNIANLVQVPRRYYVQLESFAYSIVDHPKHTHIFVGNMVVEND